MSTKIKRTKPAPAPKPAAEKPAPKKCQARDLGHSACPCPQCQADRAFTS